MITVVAELLAARVPVPCFQLVGRELHVGGEDVLAFGRQRRIEKRGNGDVEIGCSGKFAVLRGVEGAFEIVDFGADVDAAGERLDEAIGTHRVGERGKRRQIVEREIDLGDVAGGTDVANAQREGRIELRGIDEIEKGALGIDAGDDGFGGDFFAVGEDDAGDGAVFDANVLDFGLVRISTPALRAASARARVSEPSPPRGNAAEPTGLASAAARRRRTAVQPADHGPSAVPKMPRAAMVARSSSVSKNSATKSATAIGPQRRRSKMPLLPRLRTLRPVLKRFQKSSGEGESMAGGVMEQSCAKKPEISSSDAANCVYFAASFAERCAMPPAVLARSL